MQESVREAQPTGNACVHEFTTTINCGFDDCNALRDFLHSFLKKNFFFFSKSLSFNNFVCASVFGNPIYPCASRTCKFYLCCKLLRKKTKKKRMHKWRRLKSPLDEHSKIAKDEEAATLKIAESGQVFDDEMVRMIDDACIVRDVVNDIGQYSLVGLGSSPSIARAFSCDRFERGDAMMWEWCDFIQDIKRAPPRAIACSLSQLELDTFKFCCKGFTNKSIPLSAIDEAQLRALSKFAQTRNTDVGPSGQ